MIETYLRTIWTRMAGARLMHAVRRAASTTSIWAVRLRMTVRGYLEQPERIA